MLNHRIRTLVTGLALAGAIGAQAAAPATPQGVITSKVFLNIGSGTAIGDLTGNAKFPNSPDLVTHPTFFESFATDDINTPPASDVYNNSGMQLVGYFYPPSSGSYVFYLCADDNAALYLSTDDSPANKKLIAQESGWSNPRSFTEIGGGSTVEEKCSQTFAATEWASKDPLGGASITLVGGRAYYIEAIAKEGGGGDNLSVSIDGAQPIPGEYLSTIDKKSGAVSILTQPQNVTVNEGQPASFNVVADGTPPYSYQWRKNGTAIPDATNATYTLARAFRSDQGAVFSVVVTGQGNATSSGATLTVKSDTTPPTLLSVRGSDTFEAVRLTFSEPMDPASAQATANYAISGGLTITKAMIGTAPNDNIVVLETSRQAEGATHSVTVNGVKDLAGNSVAANTQAELKTFIFAAGYMLHKKYDGVDDSTGGNPDNLFNDSRYGIAPDRVDLVTRMEYPPDGATRIAADPTRNYFDTVEGFFVPPSTGDYVFFTAGADRWWLYLSTDDKPANKYLIAAEPGGWSDPRGWLQMYSGNLENRRSDFSALTQWPNGNTISLTANKRYYVEMVHHDPSWCGADDFSATFIKSGEAEPANSTAPALAGSVIGTYLDPSGSSITISQQPASTTQVLSRTAVFSIAATGASVYGGGVSLQWQKQAPGSTAWTDLSGATTSTYETPLLTQADNGTKYRVVCRVPGLSQNSAEATLTVASDAFPPKLVGAGAIPSQTGNTFDVGVSFDEQVDETSAGSMANYALSAGTISAVKLYTGSPGVVLTVSGLTAGNTYTVTVTGVKDLLGNSMPASSKEFKVASMKWGVVGGNELGLGNGVLATAENGFDVYSDAVGEWAAYDEATFVYEEVTGDFDKKVRVEYQDASSQWARAGLVARDVTNFGVDRASQEGGAAGRYQKVHVNPKTTAMGTAGNNSWEGNRRLTTGAATTSAGGGGTPLYPNAWCRMKRVGNVFTIFRSDDGQTWTQLGTTTFTDEPMPAKLFVGPEFSPENGNIGEDTGLRSVWVAKFRDYGNYSTLVTPTISINASGVITYGGVLQSSTKVEGGYAPVVGATSPYTVPKTGAAVFYRTVNQ